MISHLNIINHTKGLLNNIIRKEFIKVTTKKNNLEANIKHINFIKVNYLKFIQLTIML